MKTTDIKKLDKETQKILLSLLQIGIKPRELGVYDMYANVHITLNSAYPIDKMRKIVDIMPKGSSLSAGNSFRSGLTMRLPWNFSDENYKKRQTVFD